MNSGLLENPNVKIYLKAAGISELTDEKQKSLVELAIRNRTSGHVNSGDRFKRNLVAMEKAGIVQRSQRPLVVNMFENIAALKIGVSPRSGTNSRIEMSDGDEFG